MNPHPPGGDFPRPSAPQMQNTAQQLPNPYGSAHGSPRLGYPPTGAHWFQDSNNYDDYDDDGNNAAGDNDNEGDSGRDPKRRRIARACDMCRKKKIKCDGKMPKCGHCENYKTECIFTQQEKKRAPPKGAKYIEGLENRLGRMEHLLRLSGMLTEDNGQTDLGTLEKRLQERASMDPKSDGATPQSQRSSGRAGGAQNNVPTPATGSTPQEQITSPNSAISPQQQQQQQQQGQQQTQQGQQNPFKKDAKEVDVLADQMCSLITNNYGETRYIGSSSGFSIFSPKGIQWVNEKTGDSSFQQMIATATADDKNGWEHWRPEVFNDLFSRRIFKPLPPRQECYALLKDYFENFNCMFPLFHEPTFMHLVDKHYSLDPYEGSGWWASLNVALAIAHRLRVMSNVVGQEEDDHAWGYLKNAMAVMTELTMRNTDLLSVQALLGMALFLQGTPNPQPSFFLVAAAIRLAHSIGLHKRGSGFNLNDVENEQRKRVFWIAYLLDKDICLRSGRPPAQDDDDMNVDLPSEDPPDNVGNIPLTNTNGKQSDDAKKTMNLFRLMCTFAQIQSRVYKSLYSVRASRQSDGELLNTIGDLDDQLEKWKDSIPMDFRPEHEIKAAHTPLILHVVVLHFAYYNCLTTIHRMSVHHGYWTSRLSDYAIQGLNARPLNPRVFMSAALCVNAARTSIGLIRYIPQGDYACVWLILYYPVSSLVTLFANILQNPQDARARSDLRLMSSVVSFLSMLERDAAEANGNVKRMLSVCAEFERIARVVLDKAEREMRGRGKRKAPGAGAPLPEASSAASGKKARESGQSIKDSIGEALDEGKTLEQMQVETQAAYRRPVNTPSLAAASHAGSGAGTSPASWGQSPPGGMGSEYANGPGPGGILGGTQWAAGFNNGFTSGNGNLPPGSGPSPRPQQGYPAAFANEGTTGLAPAPDFGNFDPASIDPNLDPHGNFSNPRGMNNNMNGLAGANAGGLGGQFQQPFVPQDLWQMPMTLEWDWAEGLGLGSFTPGPMFEGVDGYGLGGMGGDGGGGGRMEGMQQ